MIHIKCDLCGKEKSIFPSRLRGDHHFCNAKCMAVFQRGKKHTEEHKRKIRESCKGLKNSGQFKRQMPINQKCMYCRNMAKYMTPEPMCSTHYHRKFYKYFRTTINGRVGVLYHRYSVEQSIGRKLNKDEVIHHINGDRSDNEIGNLQIMDKIEHLKMHANLRKKVDLT